MRGAGLFVIVLILTASPSADGAERVRPDEIISSAWDDYNSGRVTQAKSRLLEGIATAQASAPEAVRGLTYTLLSICAGSYDSGCLSEGFGLLSAYPFDTRSGNQVAVAVEQQLEGNYLGELALASGDEKTQEQWLDYQSRQPPVPYAPLVFIKQQILVARIQFARGRPIQASEAAGRAQSVLVSLKPNVQAAMQVAVWISDLIGLYLDIGDNVRARDVAAASEAFMDATLPPRGPDRMRYRLVQGRLLLDLNLASPAIAALDESLSILRDLQFHDAAKQYFLGQLSSNKVIACVDALNMSCAEEALMMHPLASVYAYGSTPAQMQSPQDIGYLALQALVRRFSNKPRPDEVTQLLTQALSAAGQPADSSALGILLRVTLLLETPRERLPGLCDLSRSAARDYIASIEAAFRNRLELFPASGIMDKVLALVLMEGVSSCANVSVLEQAELMLPLAEVYGRGFRQTDVDSLTWLAAAVDDEDRRIVSAWLRMSLRQSFVEMNLLRATLAETVRQIVAGLSNGSATASENQYAMEIATYGSLNDMNQERLRLRTSEEFSRTRSRVMGLPTARAIQEKLRSDEAFVQSFIAGGRYSSICLTKQSAVFGGSTVNIREFQNDAKLVNLAVTASYAPAAALDSQFPVRASMRMYDSMVRPLGDCLKGKSRVSWVQDAQTEQIPMSVLLSEMPVSLGEGFDLREARWLVRDIALSFSFSGRAFVAGRTLGARGGSSRDYLGIGDPVLSGVTSDGVSRADIVMRGVDGGAAEAVRRLAELPDTGLELVSVSKAIGGASDVLLRMGATERAFRERPLSEYRYLGFATHSLLRSEMPGVDEASLVLTPGTSLDTFDDGMLTASEIADLRLSARVAVLSACNTARFDYDVFSSQIRGLASAFAVAGVPATIASMWPVESRTSRSIISKAHEILAGGGERVTIAEALAEAQRAFIHDSPDAAFAHPRFWAPFVVHGDGHAVTISAERGGMVMVDYEVQSRTGGEVSRLFVEPDKAGWFAIGARDSSNGRLKSFVSGHGKRSGWSTQDPDLASLGIRIVVDGGGMLLPGYEDGGSEVAAVATVRYVDWHGTEQWRSRFGREGFDSISIGARKAANNSYLLAVLDNPRNRESSLVPQVRLITIDQHGATTRSWSFELGGITSSSIAPGMHDIDGRIGISTFEQFPAIRKMDFDADSIAADSKACFGSPRSRLYVLSSDTDRVERVSEVGPLDIREILKLPSGMQVAVGTEYDACRNTRLAVHDVSDLIELGGSGEIRPVYRESRLFSSQGRGASVTKSGNILVAGWSSRAMDLLRDESSPFSPELDMGLMEIRIDKREVSDGLLVEVRPDGTIAGRRLISAGGDMLLSDIVEFGDKYFVGGSISGQALLMSFRP